MTGAGGGLAHLAPPPPARRQRAAPGQPRRSAPKPRSVPCATSAPWRRLPPSRRGARCRGRRRADEPSQRARQSSGVRESTISNRRTTRLPLHSSSLPSLYTMGYNTKYEGTLDLTKKSVKSTFTTKLEKSGKVRPCQTPLPPLSGAPQPSAGRRVSVRGYDQRGQSSSSSDGRHPISSAWCLSS